MRVILAPHPDDELIGCFQVLVRNHTDVCVIYTEPIESPVRLEEAKRVAEEFHVQQFFSKEMLVYELLRGLRKVDLVLAPDPHYESHPAHKGCGMVVHRLLREGLYRGGYYSTEMNTPYIHVLPADKAARKRELLNAIYPSQQSLWEYDHRYWLFEGCVRVVTGGVL